MSIIFYHNTAFSIDISRAYVSVESIGPVSVALSTIIVTSGFASIYGIEAHVFAKIQDSKLKNK